MKNLGYDTNSIIKDKPFTIEGLEKTLENVKCGDVETIEYIIIKNKLVPTPKCIINSLQSLMWTDYSTWSRADIVNNMKFMSMLVKHKAKSNQECLDIYKKKILVIILIF